MKRVVPDESKRDQRTSVGGSNASVDVTSAPVPCSHTALRLKHIILDP